MMEFYGVDIREIVFPLTMVLNYGVNYTNKVIVRGILNSDTKDDLPIMESGNIKIVVNTIPIYRGECLILFNKEIIYKDGRIESKEITILPFEFFKEHFDTLEIEGV